MPADISADPCDLTTPICIMEGPNRQSEETLQTTGSILGPRALARDHALSVFELARLANNLAGIDGRVQLLEGLGYVPG